MPRNYSGFYIYLNNYIESQLFINPWKLLIVEQLSKIVIIDMLMRIKFSLTILERIQEKKHSIDIKLPPSVKWC